MVNQKETMSSCAGISGACCKVEALMSIDDRGQMVLPKDIREKAGIVPGEKMAVVSWEKSGKVCCLFLVKADDIAVYVKDFLGPFMGDNTGK
jgi:antitoxin PrlF